MNEQNKESSSTAESEHYLRIITEKGFHPGQAVVLDGAGSYIINSIDGKTGLVELQGADVTISPDRLQFPEL